MKKIFLFILVVSVISIYPQRSSMDYNTITAPAGYTLGLLNESGTSGISNNVSNITFINPAAINEFNSYSFGFSYQVQSKIDEGWVLDIGISRSNNFIPQSVGVVIPLNSMRFGIGMGQIYNASLDIGEILVTTIINPDGTGESFTPIIETTVQNYSLLFSYSFEKLFAANSDLTMGLKLNLNRLNQNESFYPFYDFSESVYKESWAVGAIYKIKYDENKSLRFGLAFESEILFNKAIEINVESPDTTGIIGVNRPPNFYIISRNFNLTGKVPARLMFDTDFTIFQQLKVLGNITNIFWSGISDEYQNQLEFSGSVVYSFSNTISSSIGAFYTNRKLKDDKDDFFGYQNKLYALFLTAGLNVKYSFLAVGLAIADSHLASSNTRKQTIVKIIVGVNIN